MLIADPYHPANPREYYKQQYYEVLDILASELKRKFHKDTLVILHEMEDILIISCNGTVNKPSNQLCNLYPSDIDVSRLMPQLSMMPEVVSILNKESGSTVKKVTTVTTICDMMNNTSSSKVMFSEVDRLLTIYLTIPLTTAAAERTFSTMRRIKTYLRSTMGQERLNHAMALHTHKSRTDEVDLTSVEQQFITFIMTDAYLYLVGL